MFVIIKPRDQSRQITLPEMLGEATDQDLRPLSTAPVKGRSVKAADGLVLAPVCQQEKIKMHLLNIKGGKVTHIHISAALEETPWRENSSWLFEK